MTQAADSSTMTLGTYTYDALSRRTELDYGNTATVKYTYSDAGDLLTLNHDLSGTADDVQYTLGYTNAHQLASEVSSKSSYNFAPASNGTDSYAVVNSLNQYPAVKAVFYGYDSRGNLTGDGNFAYSYDPENHLILANATGNANTYAYDSLGRRVTKTVNGTAVTNFLQDGDTEIAEYDASGNVLRRFVPGPAIDDLAAMIDCTNATQPNCTGNSKTEFLHVNHQGSTIAVADRSAVKLEGPYIYDAYGSGATLPGVPFKYTGQYLDAETGLYYYRARYYNPAIGRFLQTDPIGYQDNLDLYEYVSDDPLNLFDPMALGQVCPDIADCVESSNYPGKATSVPDMPLKQKDSDTIDKHKDDLKGGEQNLKFVVRDELKDPKDLKTGVVPDAAESAEGTPPEGSTAAAHRHPTAGTQITDGLIDHEGLGDAQPLLMGLPNVAYNGNRSAVHEAPKGHYRIRATHGHMTRHEREVLMNRADQRQRALERYYEMHPPE